METITINEIDFKEALVINLGTEKIELLPDKKVMYSEKKLNSQSTKPYFTTLLGSLGFLKTFGENIDFILVNDIPVKSVSQLKKMFSDTNISTLAFSKSTTSFNYNFFYKSVNARLNTSEFLKILASYFNVYHVINNSKIYVCITKS